MSDHQAMLRQPAMRIGLSVPVAVLLLYAVFTEGLANPLVGATLLVVGASLSTLTLALSATERGLPAWWQVMATLVGVGMLPILLVSGLEAPVDTFSLLFVLVIVIGAFTYAPRMRTPLIAWTLVLWGLALWWDGVRDLDLLLLHLGAGVLIAQSVLLSSGSLGRALRGAAAARADAEQRADLLARLLQVHTLERDEVLQAVVDGLEDVGFVAVAVRVPEGEELVLAAGIGVHGPLAARIGGDAGLCGLARRVGDLVVVDDPERLAELGSEHEARAGVGVPVMVDDHLEAVVAAVTSDEVLHEHQRATVELLASLAGRALRRAEAYEADERTVAELRRLEARTQDFVSTVSHELRTPLTVVHGLGNTLRTRWDDLDLRRRVDLLRRIDGNAARLSEMVRSLLDTSAFEEGRIVVARRPLGLRELLDGLLDRLASVTVAHPVAVDIPHDVRVQADRALVEHVLENLLANAAQHTPQGTRVEISCEVRDDGVEVVVADDGPGISEVDLPYVLDRFYRGGDPADRPTGGLGLGLALAQEVLHAHGSQLRIASEPGNGATFSFVLPRADPPAADQDSSEG